MNLREFIVRWNNENPLDHRFREKYKIPFNSAQHRSTNQLDILLEHIEDQVFEEFKHTVERRTEAKQLYAKGEWIKEVTLSNNEAQDLFDKIDIFKINKEDSQIKIQ